MPFPQPHDPHRSYGYDSGRAQSFRAYLERIERNLIKLFVDEA